MNRSYADIVKDAQIEVDAELRREAIEREKVKIRARMARRGKIKQWFKSFFNQGEK